MRLRAIDRGFNRMRRSNITSVLSIVAFDVATGPMLVGPFDPPGKLLIAHNTPGVQDLSQKLTSGDEPLRNLDDWKFEQ